MYIDMIDKCDIKYYCFETKSKYFGFVSTLPKGERQIYACTVDFLDENGISFEEFAETVVKCGIHHI